MSVGYDEMDAKLQSTQVGAVEGWNRFDGRWLIALFGTAVGAGILFLPIEAGLGGFWPLLITTLLTGPMAYYAHRGLSRVVCGSPQPSQDITHVTTEYFGKAAGRFVTFMYFLAIYPIVLIYGVAITTTVESLLTHQIGYNPLPRWLLAGVLIFGLTAVMGMGKHIMLIATQWLVYPLIVVLSAMTIYLIPYWSFEGFWQTPNSLGQLLLSTWVMVPVLVFSFNHAAAISQFSVSLKAKYGQDASEKASRILKMTTTLLVIFTMSFVWSCVLAVGSDGLQEARQANLPILSYLANDMGTPVIAWLGPVVAIAAIGSSFFGHWLGAHESVIGLVRGLADADHKYISSRALNRGAIAFLAGTTWIVAIINPSILDLIQSLVGPVTAIVLYLMPMYAIHKASALAPFRGRLSNVFVVISGIIAFGGVILAFL